MKIPVHIVSTLLAFLAPRALASSTPDVAIAEPARWVEPLAQPALPDTPETDKTYGFDYLLVDQQINVREQTIYGRVIYRITNAASLQQGARVSWDYDPAYSALTVHHIRVIRDGVTQERLSPALLQTIQQERDSERHLYDGRLTTFALLDDIRVGDIIDYSTTTKGWNPVFGGKFLYQYPLGFGAPLRRQRIRIIAPENRPFAIRTRGPSPPVEFQKQRQDHDDGDVRDNNTNSADTDLVYTWESANRPALSGESGAPGWYAQYPYLQISEYPAWSDVVRWGVTLYELPQPLPETIRAKAAEITKGKTTDSEKTTALLDFTQQEIRYLGIELGAGSHRPTAPDVVLARRFGDCKDKTLLFCALMRAAGLDAWPALVNTTETRALENRLPSPDLFDHVIACVPNTTATGLNATYYVDPTLSDQAGALPVRAIPDYQRALVFRPGNTAGLSTITIPDAARSSVRAEETYTDAGFDNPATLRVAITYAGLCADATRAYIRQTSREEMEKYYLNTYAPLFPGITTAAPVTWLEDTARNTLTVEAAYQIAGLWKHPDGQTTDWNAEFIPKLVLDCTTLPDTPIRKTPLSTGSPLRIEVETRVNLHQDWQVATAARQYESPGFRGTFEKQLSTPRLLLLRSSWERLDDNVPASDMAKHIGALKNFRDALGITLTYRAAAPAPANAAAAPATAATAERPLRTSWLLVLVTLLTAGACAYAGKLLYRVPALPPPLPPPPRSSSLLPLPDAEPRGAELMGLGGWLILVGIGVCLRPLWMLKVILTSGTLRFFNQDFWEALTLPGNPAYQPMWALVLLSEHVMNVLLLSLNILLVILFFKKKRCFPAVFIALFAVALFSQLADHFVLLNLVQFHRSPEKTVMSVVAIFQTVIAAAIWIPYMLVSRRVKNTFTR